VTRDKDTAARLFADACRDPLPTDAESQLACAHARTRRAAWFVDEGMRLQELERACDGGDPSGCVELASRVAAPDRRADLQKRACAPPKLILEPIALVACARSKSLQATRSSDPSEAQRLFEEACAGGAGEACLELAKPVDTAWQKLPSAAKTLAKMEERVAAYVKGCHAKAPSVEACLRAEGIQRERHRFDQARELLGAACDLDPALPNCPRTATPGLD
jgi:TPR repeat protein